MAERLSEQQREIVMSKTRSILDRHGFITVDMLKAALKGDRLDNQASSAFGSFRPIFEERRTARLQAVAQKGVNPNLTPDYTEIHKMTVVRERFQDREGRDVDLLYLPTREVTRDGVTVTETLTASQARDGYRAWQDERQREREEREQREAALAEQKRLAALEEQRAQRERREAALAPSTAEVRLIGYRTSVSPSTLDTRLAELQQEVGTKDASAIGDFRGEQEKRQMQLLDRLKYAGLLDAIEKGTIRPEHREQTITFALGVIEAWAKMRHEMNIEHAQQLVNQVQTLLGERKGKKHALVGAFNRATTQDIAREAQRLAEEQGVQATFVAINETTPIQLSHKEQAVDMILAGERDEAKLRDLAARSLVFDMIKDIYRTDKLIIQPNAEITQDQFVDDINMGIYILVEKFSSEQILSLLTNPKSDDILPRLLDAAVAEVRDIKISLAQPATSGEPSRRQRKQELRQKEEQVTSLRMQRSAPSVEQRLRLALKDVARQPQSSDYPEGAASPAYAIDYAAYATFLKLTRQK